METSQRQNDTPQEKSYPYSLTLTVAERRAIDFVGDRYPHGHDFYLLLTQTTWEPENITWDDDIEPITFLFQEFQAWNMKELFEKSQFDLFATPFTEKLLDFLDGII